MHILTTTISRDVSRVLYAWQRTNSTAIAIQLVYEKTPVVDNRVGIELLLLRILPIADDAPLK